MPINKVVVHYKKGTIEKGHVGDFFPNKKEFHLVGQEGTQKTVAVETLKAVFFVKDFSGDPSRHDQYDQEAGSGRRIQVEFNDGEVIIGNTLGYSPERPGFFVEPGDSRGNNERVFVVKSATKRVTFL